MTIQQYREYLKQGNKVECYGMKFKMMENDYIVIRNNINPNVVSENILINYNHFIDLEVQLSSSIKRVKIYKILFNLSIKLDHSEACSSKRPTIAFICRHFYFLRIINNSQSALLLP